MRLAQLSSFAVYFFLHAVNNNFSLDVCSAHVVRHSDTSSARTVHSQNPSRRSFLSKGTAAVVSSFVAAGSTSASWAYEARPVGGDSPSADTAAYNIAQKQTMERLEKLGYAIDSREEEAARLSDAMASFSYDAAASSSSSSSKKKNKDKDKDKKNQ